MIGEGKITSIGFRLSVDPEAFCSRTTELPSSSPLISQRQVIPELSTDLLKLQQLGKGATSNVYMAVHVRTFDVVALKEIEIRTAADRESIRSELAALRSQRSPLMHRNFTSDCGACAHIVKFYGCAMPSENVAVLAVEYIGGGNLQTWVEKKTPAPEPWLSHLVYQILLALQYVHRQKRTHCDIKPANILVTREGDAKLADFGCASAGMGINMVGTRRYMAPERLKGESNLPISDVWSLGVAIATAALASCPAQQAHIEFDQVQACETIMDTIVDDQHLLSDNLLSFLRECLKVDPKERSPVDELLEHPFLKMRKNWNDSCPQVSQFIESNRLRPWLPINEVVNEIANARKERQLENYTGVIPSLFPLSVALDFTEIEISAAFRKYTEANTPSNSGKIFNSFSPLAARLMLRPHSSSDLPQRSTQKLKSGKSVQDLRKRTLISTQLKSDGGGCGEGAKREVNLEAVARRMQDSLEIKDRIRRFKRHKRCFVGSQAVSWMMGTGWASDTKSAINMGNEMMKMGIFGHVTASQLFEDTNQLYRFSETWGFSKIKEPSPINHSNRTSVNGGGGAASETKHRRIKSFNAVSLLTRSNHSESSNVPNKLKSASVVNSPNMMELEQVRKQTDEMFNSEFSPSPHKYTKFDTSKMVGDEVILKALNQPEKLEKSVHSLKGKKKLTLEILSSSSPIADSQI